MKLKNYAIIGFALLALSIYCLSFGPWQTWLGAFLFAWSNNIFNVCLERRRKRALLKALSL